MLGRQWERFLKLASPRCALPMWNEHCQPTVCFLHIEDLLAKCMEGSVLVAANWRKLEVPVLKNVFGLRGNFVPPCLTLLDRIAAVVLRRTSASTKLEIWRSDMDVSCHLDNVKKKRNLPVLPEWVITQGVSVIVAAINYILWLYYYAVLCNATLESGHLRVAISWCASRLKFVVCRARNTLLGL